MPHRPQQRTAHEPEGKPVCLANLAQPLQDGKISHLNFTQPALGGRHRKEDPRPGLVHALARALHLPPEHGLAFLGQRVHLIPKLLQLCLDPPQRPVLRADAVIQPLDLFSERFQRALPFRRPGPVPAGPLFHPPPKAQAGAGREIQKDDLHLFLPTQRAWRKPPVANMLPPPFWLPRAICLSPLARATAAKLTAACT